MKFQKINSLSIILVLLVTVVMVQLEYPHDSKLLFEDEIEPNIYGRFPTIQFYVLAGETVHVLVRGQNVSFEIYKNNYGNLVSVSNSSTDFEFEEYLEGSSKMGLSVRSSDSVYVKIHTTGSQNMLWYGLIVPSIVLLVAVVIEIWRRKYHPPYFEDEVGSLSSLSVILPAGLLYLIVSSKGSYMDFDLRRKYYNEDLNTYVISLQFNSFFFFVFTVIMFLLPLYRIMNISRLQGYKSLPINPFKQLAMRIIVWSSVPLAALFLMYFDMFFSRGAEFVSLDNLPTVYLPGVLFLAIMVFNIILLEIIVLDSSQNRPYATLIVPVLSILVFNGTVPPFQPFSFYQPNSFSELFDLQTSESRIFYFTRELLTTVILLIVGFLNRRRKWFRTGT